jgi:hypothetical protein
MAGICSGARKGTPLLGEGEGEVRLAHSSHWSRSPSSLPLSQGERRQSPQGVHAIPILCGETKAQYPVVVPHQNPFKLCDFPLVTRETLLY